MRILVVGAGAVGGYFGGRLLEAGQDVTFLVRPRRAAVLRRTGLVIRTPTGEVVLPDPKLIGAEALCEPFETILLSCKAYDLEDAMTAMAPAVGPHSAILPLLNGMRHLDLLERRFGAAAVLGGQCAIASTLAPDGAIVQLAPMHALSFGERAGGERAGGLSARVERIAQAMAPAQFDKRASATILQDMWEKWLMLASLAGITGALRGSVGDIVAAPGGVAYALAVVEEVRGIAAASGHPPRPEMLERVRFMLTEPGSALTASMFRDIERRAPIEADHIIGDLIDRATGPVPVLRGIYTHLKVYEARRDLQG